MVEAKRTIIQLPDPAMEFHTLAYLGSELSVFMPLYESQYIGMLVQLYDVEQYDEARRHSKTPLVKLDRPQLNILTGSTPSNLLKFLPEIAWEQGLMSRVIMVYADKEQHEMTNIFAKTSIGLPTEMTHDLKQIATIYGEFKWTEAFAVAVHTWRTGGQLPVPNHPKLTHYNSRRLGHILKLSMVSAVDRGNLLRLEEQDFHRAIDWLTEAESHMPLIFQTGQLGPDAQAMDEIVAFINGHDLMPETKIVNFARRLVPAHAVLKVIDVMEKGDIIRAVKIDPKTGTRLFKVVRSDSPHTPSHAEARHTTGEAEESPPASQPSQPSGLRRL